jgi:hypothetical protein
MSLEDGSKFNTLGCLSAQALGIKACQELFFATQTEYDRVLSKISTNRQRAVELQSQQAATSQRIQQNEVALQKIRNNDAVIQQKTNQMLGIKASICKKVINVETASVERKEFECEFNKKDQAVVQQVALMHSLVGEVNNYVRENRQLRPQAQADASLTSEKGRVENETRNLEQQAATLKTQLDRAGALRSKGK